MVQLSVGMAVEVRRVRFDPQAWLVRDVPTEASVMLEERWWPATITYLEPHQVCVALREDGQVKHEVVVRSREVLRAP